MIPNPPYSVDENLLVEKCVGIQQLRAWIPANLLKHLHLTPAWNIVRKYYCATLIGRGACPNECLACREYLQKVFDMRGDVQTIRNPEALLTSRARYGAGIAIEAFLSKRVFPTLESDPFAPLRQGRDDYDAFRELVRLYEG